MTCGDLLVSLLAIADPMQVTERDIRLAIDLAAEDLRPGGTLVLDNVDEGSRQELLRLLNEHPSIRALLVGDHIYVKGTTHGR